MKDSQGSADTKSSTKATHEPSGDQQNIPPDTAAVDSGSASVSSNKDKKITREDIEVVQNLIERCLQLYMNKDEVVHTLVNRARIEPGFTALVWQKLEEENAEFFKAYYVRLKLKRQIIILNQLLEQQYHMMKHPAGPKAPLAPMQNGSHHMPVHNLPMGYPVLQQPPVLYMGHPPTNALGNSSSCHVVSGIPAPGNFHPMQLNSANENAFNPVSAVPDSDIKSEMSVTPAPVVSNGPFSFPSSDVSGMNMDAPAIDSAFTSDVTCSEGLQLGPNCGAEDSKESFDSLANMSWNFNVSDLIADLPDMGDPGAMPNYPLTSDTDLFLESPDQNDLVEEFFVDAVPGTSPHSEQKS